MNEAAAASESEHGESVSQSVVLMKLSIIWCCRLYVHGPSVKPGRRSVSSAVVPAPTGRRSQLTAYDTDGRHGQILQCGFLQPDGVNLLLLINTSGLTPIPSPYQ